MKNINLVLNVVALVAVGVLFYLFLNQGNKKNNDSSGNNSNQKGEFNENITSENTGFSIAYVNLDTIKENYYYYNRLEKEFEEITKNARQGLIQKENDLKTRMENLESKVMLKLKTQEEAQQDAYNMQVEYEQYLEREQNRLIKMENTYFVKYLDSLKHHVKLFNKTAGFDYIITHNNSSSLLYASPKLDVTKQVLQSMNRSELKEEEKE